MNKEQLDGKRINEFKKGVKNLLKEKEIPDGIIRAYRKAIRARVALNANVNIRDVDGWIYGVISELAQLYPDLNKLPKEEFGYSANPDPDLDIEVEVSGMPKPKHTRMTTLKVESRGRAWNALP